MKHILIVDDEPAIRSSLKRFLSEQGYAVTVSSSSEEALKVLEEGPVHVSLVDLVMPKMDGIELIHKMKEIQPEIVPIVITGFGTITSAIQAMKAGAFHYITKPFELDDISLIIHAALEHYTLREENFSSDTRWDRGNRNDKAPRWDRSDRWFSWVEWQKRLFVAKWKLDWFSPGSLIQFIEKETSSKLWDVGNIDIMREFSFINLSNDDADFVLKKFKEFNPIKPLIVESKKEWSSSSSSSGFARKTSSRGSSYRWNSSSSNSRGGYRWNK